jgi:hypothetical protein
MEKRIEYQNARIQALELELAKKNKQITDIKVTLKQMLEDFENKKTFKIINSHTGNEIISEIITRREADFMLLTLEAEDRAECCFVENKYEIL